jgi:mannitol-1-/sugar-/sorbitol-6-phosphatase
MITITCSALLFDLDGVLIDSTPAVTRVWRQWAVEHGFDPVEVVHSSHGRPSLSTVRDYLPDANHELENREVERREMTDVEGIVVWPGVRELLNALPEDRWTIVTSCTRPLAEVRLRVAGLPIPKRLVTSTDVKNGKPDPEPYMKGAAILGFPQQECVVVEDVPAGIRSGKASGARVIALRTTMPDFELKKAGPDWIVKDCSAITLAPSTDNKHSLTLELKTL